MASSTMQACHLPRETRHAPRKPIAYSQRKMPANRVYNPRRDCWPQLPRKFHHPPGGAPKAPRVRGSRSLLAAAAGQEDSIPQRFVETKPRNFSLSCIPSDIACSRCQRSPRCATRSIWYGTILQGVGHKHAQAHTTHRIASGASDHTLSFPESCSPPMQVGPPPKKKERKSFNWGFASLRAQPAPWVVL